MRDYSKLDRFLDKLHRDVYPEPLSAIHAQITARMLPEFIAQSRVPPGSRILDVGCGKGYAMELFLARGMKPVGVALG